MLKFSAIIPEVDNGRYQMLSVVFYDSDGNALEYWDNDMYIIEMMRNLSYDKVDWIWVENKLKEDEDAYNPAILELFKENIDEIREMWQTVKKLKMIR